MFSKQASVQVHVLVSCKAEIALKLKVMFEEITQEREELYFYFILSSFLLFYDLFFKSQTSSMTG